jgi:hypothetical protein
VLAASAVQAQTVSLPVFGWYVVDGSPIQKKGKRKKERKIPLTFVVLGVVLHMQYPCQCTLQNSKLTLSCFHRVGENVLLPT